MIDRTSYRLLEANLAAAEMSGYSMSELVGMDLRQLIPRSEVDGWMEFARNTDERVTQLSDTRVQTKAGAVIAVEIHQTRLRDGRIVGMVRKIDQESIAAKYLGQMVSTIELFVVLIDRDARITFVNPAVVHRTGWPLEELVGRSLFDLLPDELGGRTCADLLRHIPHRNGSRRIVTSLKSRTGELIATSLIASPLRGGGGVRHGIALMGRDLSVESASREALDSELRSRAEITAAIARLQPGGTGEETGQALCRELSGLPGIDVASVLTFDAQGGATILATEESGLNPWPAGTRLPAARGHYLMERARDGAWSEAWGRTHGGGSWGEAAAAAKICSATYAPIRQGDSILGLLAAAALDHGGPAAVKLPMVDISDFGSAASALLSVELTVGRSAAELRAEIRGVMAKRAYRPVFQVLVGSHSGEVVGYEALTRFDNGEQPDIYFATAWTVGLGAELELATLAAAIRQSRQLPAGRWLNLNVSPSLLRDPARLRRVIAGAGRPVVIEITEHEEVTEYGELRAALALLGGVQTAVDDAGAGRANFGHIVELQPDFVKLDLILIHGVDTDLGRQAMVVAMCHFARVTGSKVIAEGIETAEEAETVEKLGVDYLQGYWCGRPKPAEELTLEESKHTRPALELYPSQREDARQRLLVGVW